MSSSSKSPDTGTVNRVLRVLALFAEKEAWDLQDAARALGLPRTSAHRLLNLCKPLEYVAQNDSGRYVAGHQLYRLAARLAGDMPIHRFARPLIESIRDRIDETVLLALASRGDLTMYFSLIASPPHPLRYAVALNRPQPLAWGAAARVILAHLEAAEIEAVIARDEPSPQDGRPLDQAELRTALAAVRTDGHAVTFAQRSPDSWGIAAPFFGPGGRVLGSINVTVPAFRVAHHDLAALASLVRDAGDRLTGLLDATPPEPATDRARAGALVGRDGRDATDT